jgi:dienelactone hydrolase
MRPWLLVLALAAAGGCTSALSDVTEGRAGRIAIPTITMEAGGDERATTITGELSLPTDATDRVPAIILLHSCSGVTASLEDWAQQVNRMGFAALVIDSFTARGVREVCTGRTPVSIGSRLTDAYRALALLSVHPRIDAHRIAVLGFSHGGWVTLWASQAQFERRFLRANVEFAAHAAFYPAGCNVRLLGETDMAPGPVRIFHGTADDWTPIEACRAWVSRRQAAGRSASLVAYEGAMHAFDVPSASPPRHLPDVVNSGRCALTQQPNGVFLDNDGRPFSGLSACMTRGGTLAYDPAAHKQSITDLKAFLDESFRRR